MSKMYRRLWRYFTRNKQLKQSVLMNLYTVVSSPSVISMKKNRPAQNGDMARVEIASGYTMKIKPTSERFYKCNIIVFY